MQQEDVQVVFGDDLLVVPEEYQQDLKSLGRDGNGLLFAQQEFLLRIKAERTELVELPGLRVCACSHREITMSRLQYRNYGKTRGEYDLLSPP